MLLGAEWNAMLDERVIADTLAERRREVARELAERGGRATAETAPMTGAAAAAAATLDSGAAARDERHGREREDAARASTSSAFLALAGAIVAAAAWRKFAR